MKKFAFILLITHCALLIAQQPTQEWASRYQRTTSSPALANYLALDKLGDSYVCGTVFNSVTRNDIVLIKYNSSGDTAWTRRFNNNNYEDFPKGIAADSIGNVYITSESGPSGNLNVFLTLKYSPSGALLWSKVYGFSGMSQSPNDMVIDKQGNNLYITGTNGNNGTAITIKYNSIGDSQWVKIKQLSSFRYYGVGIAVDNNNVYTGIIRVDNVNLDEYVAVKYDLNGNEQWTAIHDNNSGFNSLADIAVDNSGNSFIGGNTLSGYTTIKFNSLGSEQWTRNYTNNIGEFLNVILTDNNGNCYVTGGSSVGSSNYDYLTIKYNVPGDSLWTRRYNGPGNENDEAYSMTIDIDGNVYITGRSIGPNLNWDYATVKYNTSGVQQWVARFQSGIAHGIAVDKFNNVFVTGRSDTGGLPGYATVKYSQVVGVNPISNEIPNQFNLFQNYPNPFNPETKIIYELPKSSLVFLGIYDILGNETAVLINQKQIAGKYEVSFNGTNLSSGIYFYHLEADDFVQSKKMVLVK